MQVKTLKVDIFTLCLATKNSPPGSYDHPQPLNRGKLLIPPGANSSSKKGAKDLWCPLTIRIKETFG